MTSLSETLYTEISDGARLALRPVASVLMLTYNHGAYLSQAIESVLAQKTTFPFEILIGEDCSTDETRAIALKYQREKPDRVRVIAWDSNVGMHRNHNHLMETARGEFIAFCEGDDYWLGTAKLQQQVEFMHAHPECGLVHGNYLNLNYIAGAWRTRVAFRIRRQLQCRSGYIYSAMLQANRIQTCTVLCRRRLVADYLGCGLGVDGYTVCDWPLSLYIAHRSKVGFIDRPIAAYRKTPGSVMNSGSAAALKQRLDAIGMVGDFCDFFGDDATVRRAALAAQHRALFWLAFQDGDRNSFAQAWEWLSQHSPGALSSGRVLAMRVLIRFSPLRRATIRVLSAGVAIKHRIQFRGDDGRRMG